MCGCSGYPQIISARGEGAYIEEEPAASAGAKVRRDVLSELLHGGVACQRWHWYPHTRQRAHCQCVVPLRPSHVAASQTDMAAGASRHAVTAHEPYYQMLYLLRPVCMLLSVLKTAICFVQRVQPSCTKNCWFSSTSIETTPESVTVFQVRFATIAHEGQM